MSENTMPELPDFEETKLWPLISAWTRSGYGDKRGAAGDQVEAEIGLLMHAYARAYAEQKVAKEREDAERFRFLRDKAHPDWEPAGGPDAVWTLHFTSAEVWPNDFTAAVDFARARS